MRLTHGLSASLSSPLLLLVFLHGYLLANVPLVRATHVPLQDHSRNHYYAMHLHPDVNPLDVATSLGAAFEGQIGELEDHYLFSIPRSVHGSPSDDPINRRLKKRTLDDGILQGILYVEQQRASSRHHKRGFVRRQQDETPELIVETARALEIFDPLFPVQWHLLNPIQLGHDVNVTGVWREGLFGHNVTVAIVDDGLDMDSLDLKDNYFAEGSYDFNDHGPVPKPKLSDDQHGTRCAGEIAAVKNDVCGVGVAYRSRVSGIRILSGDITDADEAIALNYAPQDNHIYSCSWGPPDDGKSMDAPGLLIKRAFVNGINNGRGGLGSIYVFASGNGGAQQDNCNFDGYTNSIYSITVGAVDRMGQHPYYSELCSAQLVVTYSSGSGDYIHTTDVGLNKCADKHGGTSAAAPLAAGIFALALGVRPDLSWRDLQHLCVQTAQIVDESDSDWETVADGRRFNHKYGFGKLDAYKLVEAAKSFVHVKPQAWYHSEQVMLEQDIPDNDAQGLISVLNVSPVDLQRSNLEALEHIQVRMNLTHQRRGDISIDLTSPLGIISHIATKRKFDTSSDGMVDWYFMSVKHWGESPIGNWTVQVRDTEPGFTGTWHSWQLILWGSSIDASIAKPHPLPGTEEDPTAVDTQPLPEPTVPPAPSSSPSELPSSSFWPWSSEHRMLWVYGSIAGISLFLSVIGLWYFIQKRKARLLQTHGVGREDYEFEMLPNEGDDGVHHLRAGELYDAFAGGEEYVKSENGLRRKGKEPNDETIDDGEMTRFLDDDNEEKDGDVNEKVRW